MCFEGGRGGRCDDDEREEEEAEGMREEHEEARRSAHRCVLCGVASLFSHREQNDAERNGDGRSRRRGAWRKRE